MNNSQHDNPRSKSPLMNALNYAAEASATMIPLVALILGIGMMRFLPANVTTPLFKSDQEARKFFEDNGIGIPSKSPILLVSATCVACDELRAELWKDGVGFEEIDIQSELGQALYKQAKYMTTSPELPKIIVEAQIVDPNVAAVKRVIKNNR